jgi:hypothetical protein
MGLQNTFGSLQVWYYNIATEPTCIQLSLVITAEYIVHL